MAEEEREFYLQVGDEIDPERIILKKPTVNTYTQGSDKIEWVTQTGRYLDDEGNECELFIELPEQYYFGVNEQYPMGTKEEDQVLENLKGLQICYQIDSKNEEENDYVRSICDALHAATVTSLEEECAKKESDEETDLPDIAFNSWVAAERKGDSSLAVKPVYSHPMVGKGKKKIPDLSKSERMYIKLITSGKGRKLRAITPIHGPGDKPINPLKLVNKRGRLHPVIKWEGSFLGAHGKSPYGSSVKFRVSEANHAPARARGLPSRRMLGKNTAPPVEDDNSSDEDFQDPRGNDKDAGTEDGTFQDGDDTDPATELLNKKTKKPSKSSKTSSKSESSKSKSRIKSSNKAKTAKAQARKRALEKKRAKAKPAKSKKKVVVVAESENSEGEGDLSSASASESDSE